LKPVSNSSAIRASTLGGSRRVTMTLGLAGRGFLAMPWPLFPVGAAVNSYADLMPLDIVSWQVIGASRERLSGVGKGR
jgi:hypothetical protein